MPRAYHLWSSNTKLYWPEQDSKLFGWLSTLYQAWEHLTVSQNAQWDFLRLCKFTLKETPQTWTLHLLRKAHHCFAGWGRICCLQDCNGRTYSFRLHNFIWPLVHLSQWCAPGWQHPSCKVPPPTHSWLLTTVIWASTYCLAIAGGLTVGHVKGNWHAIPSDQGGHELG